MYLKSRFKTFYINGFFSLLLNNLYTLSLTTKSIVFYNYCARTSAMSLALHLSSLPPFLLLALLSSLIGKTNGIPLSADNAIIHAVQPACTTLQGDSTSCNVGINTVPSLVTLDGGYEWLTIQPTTITESGSTLKTNEAVWTAVQTSYLDVKPVTTTATNGATTVSTSTEYVSFITTTKPLQEQLRPR